MAELADAGDSKSPGHHAREGSTPSFGISTMPYFIGTSGYIYQHWIGKFYPSNIKKNALFKYYTSYFNTVEINYSFYHTPKESTILKWYKIAPDNFYYTLKVPRVITHMRKLSENSISLIENFVNLALLLKEKCGIVLFQMPPSFKLTEQNLKKIERVFKFLFKLKDKPKIAFEFRHKSWFLSSEIIALARKYQIAFSIVSAPELPFIPVETSDNIYIRLHGKDKWYAYNYSKKELDELSLIIKEYLKKKKNVWVYFNNDYNAYAPKNALYLKKKLENG